MGLGQRHTARPGVVVHRLWINMCEMTAVQFPLRHPY